MKVRSLVTNLCFVDYTSRIVEKHDLHYSKVTVKKVTSFKSYSKKSYYFSIHVKPCIGKSGSSA